MTAPQAPDPVVIAWLEEGPNELPDVTRRAIAIGVRTSHQRRRDLTAPWRNRSMNSTLSRLVVAATAVVVALGGLYVFNANQGSSPGQLGGPPVSSTSARPTSSGDLELTETFTSAVYGFSIRHPESAVIQAATSVVEPDLVRRIGPSYLELRAFSAVIPEGRSIDDWIDESLTGAKAGTCNELRTKLPKITVDGHAGRIRAGCAEGPEATVVVGRRVYVFTLFGEGIPNTDGWLEAFLATVDLRPEDALAPGAGPSLTPFWHWFE